MAGACFALGLKFAGTAEKEAFDTLFYFCHMFTSLTAKSIAELAGKSTIETCLNVLLLSASMVRKLITNSFHMAFLNYIIACPDSITPCGSFAEFADFFGARPLNILESFQILLKIIQ